MKHLVGFWAFVARTNVCEVSASPLSLKTFVCVCESACVCKIACVCIYEKDNKGKTENLIEYVNEYSDHGNRRRDRKKLTKIDVG